MADPDRAVSSPDPDRDHSPDNLQDGPASRGHSGGPSRDRPLPRWQVWLRLLRLRVRGSATQLIITALVAVVFAGSLWVIARELQGFEYAEVGRYLSELPVSYVFVALGLTSMTFIVLAGYDALALRYVDVCLSRRRIAFSAFVGYAVSQAIGNPILTGGSVRYRLYSLWGLSPAQVAKSILFAGASFWLGFCTLGAVAFLFAPIGLADAFQLSVAPSVLGIICLVPVISYAGLTGLRSEPVTLWGWTLEVPPLWMLPVQVALAMGDLLLASSVVFVLLPPEIGISLPHLVAVYLMALLAGLVSHVPGGLGVFESVMLLLLTPEVPPPIVLGALLAYRGIFHLLPLMLAMIAFGAFELWRGMEHLTGEVGVSE